jgi:hypothetical protein
MAIQVAAFSALFSLEAGGGQLLHPLARCCIDSRMITRPFPPRQRCFGSVLAAQRRLVPYRRAVRIGSAQSPPWLGWGAGWRALRPVPIAETVMMYDPLSRVAGASLSVSCGTN